MKNKLKNKFHWIYLVGFFLILALPLLNLPPWFSPPDWGKTIVFRIVLSVLIFLFIYQILYQKTDEKFSLLDKNLLGKKSKSFWPFWLLTAFLGINFLATIFSLDSRFSLWGSPYRSGGFLNLAFYIIFAILFFLILRKKDWRNAWDFSILIGILVSAIAILQQYGRFQEILIASSVRPPSTIGGPIFLAIYLLLLTFLTLSFLLKEKNWGKKLFYSISLVLFIFVAIFITQTKAVMIGLPIGFLYFFFFYPVKKTSTSMGIKIITLIILTSAIGGLFYIDNQPKAPKFIQQNLFLSRVATRVFPLEQHLANSRFSGWTVSWEALKDRPILGYGPENFSIAFDKYYDPSLPEIGKTSETFHSWWDRAHNFIFDISVTSGIPALIVYLLLFGALFWQLQKQKKLKPEQSLIYHGAQATFIGYLTANFFSFDTFSTYLILFLLIGYSLHLISQTSEEQFSAAAGQGEKSEKSFGHRTSEFLFRHRKSIIFLSVPGLIWFIWAFNIKPFQINTQINVAKYFVENNKCEQGLAQMENVLPKKSFLDSYLRLKYIDYIRKCEVSHPEKSLEYIQKGVELLKENSKVQPYSTRTWLLLSGFTNALVEKEGNLEKQQELIKEVNYYLEKAQELSPSRQEISIEWIKASLVSKEYQKAKEKANQCIGLNPNMPDCYWYKALSEIFLGDLKKAKEDIKVAEEKGYESSSVASLHQLANAYGAAENYQEAIEVYKKLIGINPKEPQYHASLAFIYKELGEIGKARQEALKVLELQPASKEEVEMFLRTLTAD